MTSSDNSDNYRTVQFGELARSIRDNKERDCEGLKINERYHASGLAIRSLAMASDDTLFLFHLVDTFPNDRNNPPVIQARFKYGEGLTGELESSLRTSEREKLPIKVKGYLENKTFVVEELEFNQRKYTKKTTKQFCIAQRDEKEGKK